MQTLTTSSSRGAAIDRGPVLLRHGFKHSAGAWHHGTVAYHEVDGWHVFSAPWPETADPLRALAAPGLWKPICDGRQARRIFAVRERWTHEDDLVHTDEDRCAFDAVVEWALATADGVLPHGWMVPERASIDACLAKSRLTLVHRAFTRQMQILHAPDRLALRLPVLSAVPANLPEAHARWLRTLLLEAQNAHHLFRLGFVHEGTQTSVIAEIDLTGVPSMLLESLLSKSCDALRWVVAWLVESADFLTQADVASRALEICAAPEPNP